MSILQKKVKIAEDVLAQEVGNEAMILNLSSERYYGLDEIGSRMWQLFAQHEDLQQVFDCMLQEYNVSPELLEEDMNRIISRLSEEKLISVI